MAHYEDKFTYSVGTLFALIISYCINNTIYLLRAISPCIMCVQYRGGCSVPWGVFSTVGGYLEYRGGCSVPWGDIMINVGGYLEYRGGCSVPWGDIMSTVGGYLEYRGGCSVPWGIS